VDNPHYSFSEWYAYFGVFFMLDEYLSLQPQAPVAPLPQDTNGYMMRERSPSFDGGVIRQHDWMVAMSAHISDVPRYRGSVYQLERQSRLDIWHENVGLIIGGGHSMVGSNLPLANFLLLTGYADVVAEYGLISGGDEQARRSMYSPRAAKATISTVQQTLEANFGHGNFVIETAPLDRKQLELRFNYDILAGKKALIQLPLIVYHDSSVTVDGQIYDRSTSLTVKKQIRMANPTTDSAVSITVPPQADILLRASIEPLRWYGGEHKDQRYRPYYQIALLSLQLDCPHEGSGSFSIQVD